MSGPADSLGSILFALGANLAVALAKSVGTLLTGSAIEVKALLLGQSADPQVLARMRDHLQAQPGSGGALPPPHAAARRRCHGRGEGCMQPVPSDTALAQAINCVERGFRAQVPAAHWLFFEPDIDD